jgi:hypothetical protein
LPGSRFNGIQQQLVRRLAIAQYQEIRGGAYDIHIRWAGRKRAQPILLQGCMDVRQLIRIDMDERRPADTVSRMVADKPSDVFYATRVHARVSVLCIRRQQPLTQVIRVRGLYQLGFQLRQVFVIHGATISKSAWGGRGRVGVPDPAGWVVEAIS